MVRRVDWMPLLRLGTLSHRILGSRARRRVDDRDDLISEYPHLLAAGTSSFHLITKIFLLLLLLLGVIRRNVNSVGIIPDVNVIE